MRGSVVTVQSISPEEVHQSRGSLRVIDVREPHELRGELGHIPGVESVPLATVEREAATWDRDAKLVMVCRSGGRSGRAADLLVRLGFRHVLNMTGGMQAYRAAGFLVELGSLPLEKR